MWPLISRMKVVLTVAINVLMVFFNIMIFREKWRITETEINVNINNNFNVSRHNKDAVPILAASVVLLLGIIMHMVRSFQDQIGPDVVHAVDLFVYSVVIPTTTYSLHSDLRKHALEFYGIRIMQW